MTRLELLKEALALLIFFVCFAAWLLIGHTFNL